jgi:hypothetical protein
MAEIKGTLLADWCPDGKLRVVFQVAEGTGHEPIFAVKNLDAAEKEFVRTLGLRPERAAILRAQLERNKVFCVKVTLDNAVAPMFATHDRRLSSRSTSQTWREVEFLVRSNTDGR